jgi:hypothetical protein
MWNAGCLPDAAAFSQPSSEINQEETKKGRQACLAPMIDPVAEETC